MKNIVFFQNILTPYRISFFNQLVKYNQTEKVFRVYFMNKTERGRYWDINLKTMLFPFILGNSFYAFIRKYHFHFNPALLLKLISSKDEIVLMGAWNNFNNLILVFLKRLGLIKNRLHIWSEANYYSARLVKNTTIVDRLRNFVLNTIDGFILVPGEMALMTLNAYNIKPYKYILLPNLIDDKAFVINEVEIKEREKNIKPVMVIPARLNEKTKGLLRFFENLGEERLLKLKIFVLGDGADRELIQTYIDNNNLDIKLCGHVTESEMIYYYKMANLFALPSITDPSPLSVVESVYMHLPLLVSNRCGNHFEAVKDGVNGFVFDPLDAKNTCEAFDRMIEIRDDWYKMGEESFKISRKVFDNEKVIKNFISTI